MGYKFEDLSKSSGRPFSGDFFPSFFNAGEMVGYHINGFNFPLLPAITSSQPDKISIARWGLIPDWIKSGKEAENIRIKTLNARSESVFDKVAFSKYISISRCLIPVSGFFEWTGKPDGQKIPNFIYHIENRIFYLAAIASVWQNPDDHSIHPTFSILTIRANTLMEKINNTKKRMPLVLSEDTIDRWLNRNTSVSEINEILNIPVGDVLQSHTISGLISSTRHETNRKEVIEPYFYSKGLFD